MPSPPAVALQSLLPTELLSYVLQQTSPTSLIICSTREAFISSLYKATLLAKQQGSPEQDIVQESKQAAGPVEDISVVEEKEVLSDCREHRNPLLVPTLCQMSTSRYTTTTFIPTVSHIRAYLATLASTSLSKPFLPATNAQTLDKQSTPCPLLVVYGLIRLHNGTSEWSAQGLGSTCADLVEAGVKAGMKIVIIEQREVADSPMEYHVGEAPEEKHTAEEPGGSPGLQHMQREVMTEAWYERLPILSGTFSAGASSGYGGRTVEVCMVLRRWCQFRRGDWSHGDDEKTALCNEGTIFSDSQDVDRRSDSLS